MDCKKEINEEVDEVNGDTSDSFEEFPRGAVSYPYEVVIERLKHRAIGFRSTCATSEATREEAVAPEEIPTASKFATISRDLLKEAMKSIKDVKGEITVSLKWKLASSEEGSVLLNLSEAPDKHAAERSKDDEHETQESRAFQLRKRRRADVDSQRRLQHLSTTPSPAKTLRRWQSGRVESESELSFDGEEDGELEETEPELQSDDSEYFPDTQEDKGDPSDYRVPHNAVPDSLDLEY